MIAYLEGTVRSVRPDAIILQVGGVGYAVFCVGFEAKIGDTLTLHTHHVIREDRQELYGFSDEDVKELFEAMIEVNGVGPKLAQKILSHTSANTVRQNILTENVDFLIHIPGVGKKTAQKIILELKGVLVTPTEEKPAVDDEAVEALVNLGYHKKDIIEVLGLLDADTTEERIRSALRALSPSS